MWRTLSRRPGLSEAMDGVPHAAASTTVIPHPSLGEGNTFAHAPRNSDTFRSSLTKPRKVTASCCPSRTTRRSSSGRKSPVPAMSSRRSGRVRARQRQRFDRQSYPFITLEPSHVQEPRITRARFRGRRREAHTVHPGMNDADAVGADAAADEVVPCALADGVKARPSIDRRQWPLGRPDHRGHGPGRLLKRGLPEQMRNERAAGCLGQHRNEEWELVHVLDHDVRPLLPYRASHRAAAEDGE